MCSIERLSETGLIKVIKETQLQWRRDSQHNNTQHNDIQHTGLNCNADNNVKLTATFLLAC